MKIDRFAKSGFVACLLALGLVNVSQAVDLAAAVGTLAEISAISVQAKADLVAATSSGDVNAIAEASKRSDAVDAAVAAAKTAASAMEQALLGDDEDAANSAADDLAAAVGLAKSAQEGASPEVAESSRSIIAKKKPKGNSGGGPGKPFDPVNIYDVPWQTQGVRAYYAGLFGAFHDAQSFGHGNGFGDKDATEQ